MDPALVMTLQLALAFAGFAMIAEWHVGPALQRHPIEDALALLCVFHSFRYIALAQSMPGHAFPPGEEATFFSLGADVTPAALALIAALMFHARAAGAIQAAWIFNLIGLADFAVSAPLAVRNLVHGEPNSLGWLAFVFYAPALVITHMMMLRRLFRHASWQDRMNAAQFAA